MLKKDSISFLRLLKFLILKNATITVLKFLIPQKDSITFLWLLKFLILKKGYMTFLWLLKFLILKKGYMTFLRLLKFLIMKKDSITSLRLLKVFNFEKWLHHILITLKVFQNSFSVKCWWTAASEDRLLYHNFIKELDLLWVPNCIALGIYFLFGTKFSWNEGIDTCLNVECVLLGCNFDFLGGFWLVIACYWWLLLVTARYCSFQYERWRFYLFLSRRF